MSDKCDSTHDGNGRPGSGIMFSAAEKLLRAVSVLMDTCGECGVDSSRALAAVKRRENQLIDASARHDAKVSALRERLAAANAKIAEMARLAEETRLNVEAITGVGGWRPIETAPKYKEVQLWRDDAGAMYGIYCAPDMLMPEAEFDKFADEFPDSAEQENWWAYTPQGAERLESPDEPTHWMPLPQPPKEADDE